MRSILTGLFFFVVGSLNAPAGVLYSFSQTPPQSEVGITPTINFDFTTPSLLTNSTVIRASDLTSPLIHFQGLDLSVLSVTIDPGLNSETSYPGSRGVAFIGIEMGRGSQELMSLGLCFDSNISCFSTSAPIGAQAFDHFGTYTQGYTSLTISSTEPSQTATPEPRLEIGAGFLVLLAIIGVTRRTANPILG